MHGQVQKWGNSLGLRIPAKLVKKLDLHNGSEVEIDTKNNVITITKYTSELDSLLQNINASNCHHESFKDDNNIGFEIW
jgi:antitoxin MazE